MDALSQYISLYRDHSELIMAHAPEVLNRPRPHAFERLALAKLPKKGDEGYPALSVEEMFAPDYGVNINRVGFTADDAEPFRCGVPNISTLAAMVVNDSFQPSAALLRALPQGVEVMSLAQAAAQMPELVDKYYNHLTDPASAAAMLNTLLCQDGVFIRVARGVKLEKPIQVVNLFNASQPFMAVRRVLIIIEDGASAQVLFCDHTNHPGVQYLSSQVAEVFLGRDARLDLAELEESTPSTSRHAQLFASQEQGSALSICGTTLAGGRTRNSYVIDHKGEHVETRLAGMAIADASQIVDNATCVLHHHPQGHSDQMFKYILDDTAQGSFYGTIVVDEAARFTKAYQSNRNVLASTQAKMYTRPQLEIYCDEVKCSHGATIGQLDQNALFYMRQRGIPEQQAKTMLMQAFMSDVIDTIAIPALKSRLHQLVELRLSGSPDLCKSCRP